MSIRLISDVLEMENVTTTETLVLLVLANFADDQGRAWPAMATIARMAKISERRARSVIRKLESDGHLLTIKSLGRRSNAYQLTLSTRIPEPRPDAPNPEASSRVHPRPTRKFSAPNPEVFDANPEIFDTQPGSQLPPNRQEPSKEPSREPKKERARVRAALCARFPEHLVERVLERRRERRWPITDTWLTVFWRELSKLPPEIDPTAAFELMAAKGWQGVKYAVKELRDEQPNGQSARSGASLDELAARARAEIDRRPPEFPVFAEDRPAPYHGGETVEASHSDAGAIPLLAQHRRR